MYADLTDCVPINLLIPTLKARGVITQYDQDVMMQTKPLDMHKTSYLLDEKILKGLEINFTKPFDDFLQVMVECDDPIGYALAHELKVKCGITSPTEHLISSGINCCIVMSVIKLSVSDEIKVGDDLETDLKDPVKGRSASYLARELWIYAICRIEYTTIVE